MLTICNPPSTAAARHGVFSNGRLLSAGDLRTEQDARRHADLWLGQGCGDGVVYGLEVSEASTRRQQPLLLIRARLAISRAGQALEAGM